MGATSSSAGTASVMPSDLEKQKLLAKPSATALPAAQSDSDGLRPLVLACVGLCLSLAAVLTYFRLFLDAFSQPWMWPLTGFFMTSGHLSLWLSSPDSPPRIAQHLSLAALILETVALFALSSPYFFRTFAVPFWWWQANVMVLLWPAMVLIVTAIYLIFTTVPVPPESEQKRRWAYYLAPCGLYLVASTCFMLSCLLMFAGGTAVRDYIINILPDGGLPPGVGQEIITSTSKRAFGFSICHLDQGNCSLQDMPMNQWSAVRTGGNTACLVGDYAFRVWRGNSSKLLIVFDGGGSCWNWATFVGGFCSPAVGFLKTGIMDMKDPNNPYHDYTLVEIVYCSGDVFSGAAEQFWIMPAVSGSTWKPQKGYENTLAVLEWTKAQFGGPEGALQDPLDSFVIIGESSGALGVQMWQHDILQRFKGLYRDKDTFLLADSFLGLMVNNTIDLQRYVIDIWRVCDTPLVPAAGCRNRELHIPDLVVHNLETFRDVRLLMILSKFDTIQILFADLILLFHSPLDILWAFISGAQTPESVFPKDAYYQRVTAEMSRLAVFSQFAVYLITGTNHGFIFNKMQMLNNTTPRGWDTGCNETDNGQTLLQWIRPQTPKPNQCWQADNATPWSDEWCNKSINWVPGTCAK